MVRRLEAGQYYVLEAEFVALALDGNGRVAGPANFQPGTEIVFERYEEPTLVAFSTLNRTYLAAETALMRCCVPERRAAASKKVD